MRLILKILGVLFAIFIVALIAGFAYLFLALPKKEPPHEVTIEITPERLVKGKYLVNHVVVCTHCHSQRHEEFWATPRIPRTEGQGSLFLKQDGFGELYSPNITPHTLSSWSNGELIRAVTAGVNKAGDPLFPIMPYQIYAQLKNEDLYAVIAYIRSLKPHQAITPRSKLEFPLNLIVRTIPGPTPVDPQVQSDLSHYMAKISGCIDCHTPTNDRGQPLPGMELAGGQKFGTVRSANITPDPDTGIGKWTKEDFIATFKKWQAPELRQVQTEKERNTVMPWISYSGMREEDLGLIYDYLITVKPIKNKVEKFEAPG